MKTIDFSRISDKIYMLNYLEDYTQESIRKGKMSAVAYACMDRTITDNNQTIACVSLSKERNFVLTINPELILKVADCVYLFTTEADVKLEEVFKEVFSFIVTHEFFHIVLQHLGRSLQLKGVYSQEVLNYAADLAVNSLLIKSDERYFLDNNVLMTESIILNLGLLLPGPYASSAKRILTSGQHIYGFNAKENENCDRSFHDFMFNLVTGQSFDYYILLVDEFFKKYGRPISMCLETSNIEGLNESKSKGNPSDVIAGFLDIPSTIEDTNDTSPLDVSDIEIAVDKLKNRILPLVEKARKIGKTAGTYNWLEEWLNTKVIIPWEKILIKTLSMKLSASKFKRTYANPSRRIFAGLLKKGIQRKRETQLLVVIDTSGSMQKEDYIKFSGVLKSIIKKGYSGKVLQWDYNIQQIPEDISVFLKKTKMELSGGGGTNMKSAVQYVAKNYPEYDTVLVVTDGCTEMFTNGTTPVNNLIWLITIKAEDIVIAPIDSNVTDTIIYI